MIQAQITNIQGLHHKKTIPVIKKRSLGAKSFLLYKSQEQNNHIPESDQDQESREGQALSPNKNKKVILELNQELIQAIKAQKGKTIQDINSYPFRAIGLVRSKTKKGTILGTGFLVGPRLVMTCGHNIYYHITNQKNQQVEFIPAQLLKNPTVIPFKAKQIFLPHQYTTVEYRQEQNQQQPLLYDFALIQLDTPLNLQNYFGSFAYDFQWENTSSKQPIINNLQILGFNINQLQQAIYQHHNGSVIHDLNYLVHRMVTIKGASGSPIFEEKNGQYFVRGVHLRDVTSQVKAKQTIKGGLILSNRIYEEIQANFRIPFEIYDFHYQNVQDEHMKEILHQIWRKVEKEKQNNPIKLNFWLNNIGEAGCLQLSLSSNNLCYLKELNLRSNNVGTQGCAQLSKAHFFNLELLELSNNNILAEGCKKICEAKWKNLRILALGWNNIGDLGCFYLQNGQWINFYELSLQANRITQQGCRYLAKAQWHNLQTLNLYLNQVGVLGCRQLIRSNGSQTKQATWKNFKTLEIYNNNIRKKGYRQLRQTNWEIVCQTYFKNEAVISGKFI